MYILSAQYVYVTYNLGIYTNISSVLREDGHVGHDVLEDNKYNCDLQSLCTLLVILITVDLCTVKHAVLWD